MGGAAATAALGNFPAQVGVLISTGTMAACGYGAKLDFHDHTYLMACGGMWLFGAAGRVFLVREPEKADKAEEKKDQKKTK
mmetsp:Transcript_1697/g.3848  ORF Transcript_1697/g.3848 Transcript_1697/m.3848 type:complete len:81 (+) Transcript_1697:243-485(+)